MSPQLSTGRLYAHVPQADPGQLLLAHIDEVMRTVYQVFGLVCNGPQSDGER